ncbi:MAG TPA: DNA polymerase/3'-5' exonuclease PolX [Chloroflexota bacterium]|nr:DNA polymerase/3'-5' exonuclease PolX [Chloroflexota bacterium]
MKKRPESAAQIAAGDLDQMPTITNQAAARMLNRIAQLLEAKGESPFRVRAYREAAAQIEAMQTSVSALARAGTLESIPGVGPSIAAKLSEYLKTGQCIYLAELQRTVPEGIECLMDVPGIGPARARLLAQHLDVHTPEDLIQAAEAHRIRELPGFGPRSEKQLLIEAQRWAQREHRLLLGIAWPIADQLINLLRAEPVIECISLGGSLRRMRETVGDLDILAAAAVPEAATKRFTELPIVREVLASGPTKVSVLLESGLQVDLRVVEPSSWGAALQHFTGSKQHNIHLRDLAIARGLKLNEYGIYETATGRRIGGETEEDVYHALNLEWIPPELREDRGEIQAASDHTLPALVERGDLHGDLHVHTDWSDGKASIETMAEAAKGLDLDYIAITDHSKALTVAHGLNANRLRLQRQAIDELNRKLAPFRIFTGAEVDILPDGSLDISSDVAKSLDYICVSVHSHFKMDRAQMTQRIIRAISHPFVNTLNHPTGRLIDKRPGYEVDLEAVLRCAAARRVAVEINSAIDRLDLDDVWARRAKDLGCRLVVNSDSHLPGGFQNLRFGVAVARRAWLSRRDLVNTLPQDGFVTWLQQARQPRAA